MKIRCLNSLSPKSGMSLTWVWTQRKSLLSIRWAGLAERPSLQLREIWEQAETTRQTQNLTGWPTLEVWGHGGNLCSQNSFQGKYSACLQKFARNTSIRYYWGCRWRGSSKRLLRLLTAFQGGCSWVSCRGSGFAKWDVQAQSQTAVMVEDRLGWPLTSRPPSPTLPLCFK